MRNPANINVLMTNIKTLKDLGFLAEELEEALTVNAIRFVQDSKVQTALGTNLYESILSSIGVENVEPRFEILLDSYIVNAIGYFVQAELAVSMTKKLRNMGVVETSDDNVAVSNFQDVKFLTEHYNSRGRFYLDALLKYIKQNETTYPEWCDLDCGDIAVDRVQFRNAIYIPKGKLNLYRS